MYTENTEKAKSYRKLSHYTNIEAFEMIVKNKSLRLTRIDKMNDLYEEKRIDELWKGKIFLSSFTHRDNESYMFWEIYAKEDGLLLEFDNGVLHSEDIVVYSDKECTEAFEKYVISQPEYTNNKDYKDWLFRNAEFCDIEYTDDFEKYQEEDTDLKELYKDTIMVGRKKDFKYNKNPGLIKGIEWDAEEETRLRVALSYKGMSNNVKKGPPITPFDYVYIKLSDELLSNMIITMNPWSDDDFEEKLNKIVDENLDISEVSIKKSSMIEQIKI